VPYTTLFRSGSYYILQRKKNPLYPRLRTLHHSIYNLMPAELNYTNYCMNDPNQPLVRNEIIHFYNKPYGINVESLIPYDIIGIMVKQNTKPGNDIHVIYIRCKKRTWKGDAP